MVDRFVLTLINNRQVKASDFLYMESGAVSLTDEGRRAFLKGWQEKKKERLTHPYLGEKLSWGMIPYVQALLFGPLSPGRPRRLSTIFMEVIRCWF